MAPAAPKTMKVTQVSTWLPPCFHSLDCRRLLPPPGLQVEIAAPLGGAWRAAAGARHPEMNPELRDRLLVSMSWPDSKNQSLRFMTRSSPPTERTAHPDTQQQQRVCGHTHIQIPCISYWSHVAGLEADGGDDRGGDLLLLRRPRNQSGCRPALPCAPLRADGVKGLEHKAARKHVLQRFAACGSRALP